MIRIGLKTGDWVVFTTTKFSNDPGPRAHDIHPARYGDTYHYQVDKYWMVGEELPDGQLLLVTRKGKRHVVAADDPRLRRASLFELCFRRNRFPSRASTENPASGSSASQHMSAAS